MIKNNLPAWTPLNDGDIIDVIAPGYGSISNPAEISEIITKIGFQARIPHDLIDEHPLGYSNSVEYRRESFSKAISSEANVVWAIRGGRGSSSVFAEGIDQFRNFVKAPKLFIGFSDITAIHLYINTVLGWPSLHWGYLKEGREKIIFDEIAALLKGEIKELHYKLTPVNASAKQVKIIDDTCIIGGNASLIQRSIGTDTMPDTKDKILFMEDVEEAPTRINELFTHFDRAGLFKKPKAIILGDFISDLDETDKEGYRILEEMFANQMDQRSIPVFHSNEFGHILTNKPLFLNTPTKIIQQVSGAPTLINATNNW